MRKTVHILAVVAMGMLVGGTARAEARRPLLRVFENGSGRVVSFDRGVQTYEHVWETGVLPGASSHGQVVRDSGWIAHRDGELRVNARTQVFADGTAIYREVTADSSGHLVRVRFYDTHSDGSRQGFRLDGTLPDGVAFAPAPLGGTLSAAR
jgi:hypothetical protein